MSKKQGQAALKAIESAFAALLAEAPIRPAAQKLALHPIGSFEFSVQRIFVKVSEKVTATEVAPGVTFEAGTPRIRVELASAVGVVREDYTMWTAADGKKVWIGLSGLLTSVGGSQVVDIESLAALIGKVGTFTVRHEVIPAKGQFPARTIATIRAEKKAK